MKSPFSLASQWVKGVWTAVEWYWGLLKFAALLAGETIKNNTNFMLARLSTGWRCDIIIARNLRALFVMSSLPQRLPPFLPPQRWWLLFRVTAFVEHEWHRAIAFCFATRSLALASSSMLLLHLVVLLTGNFDAQYYETAGAGVAFLTYRENHQKNILKTVIMAVERLLPLST